MALSAKDWATECARQELKIIAQQKHIRELEADLRNYGAHKKSACVFGPIGHCECGLKDVLARCSSNDASSKQGDNQ